MSMNKGTIAAGGRLDILPLPPPNPNGAIVHINFQSAVYLLNAVEVPIADLIGGVPTVTPDGVEITDQDGNLPIAGPDFLTELTTLVEGPGGFTLYLEWELLASPVGGPILAMFDTPNPDDWTQIAQVESFGASVFYGFDGSGDFSALAGETGDANQLAVNRLAISWGWDLEDGNYRTSFSLNGVDVRDAVGNPAFRIKGWDDIANSMANLSAGTPGVGAVFFGYIGPWFWGNENIHLRKITLFGAQSPLALPSVSNAGELPAAPAAPVFDDVKFLCSWNGSDAATSATDDSNTPHTIVFNGNAQLDTTEKKFGTAALELSGSGTGDYCHVANHADFDIARDPFTAELELFIDDTAQIGTLLGVWDAGAGANAWRLLFDNGNLKFESSWEGGTEATLIDVVSGISASTWAHIRAEKDVEGWVRIYVDGVFKAKAALTVTVDTSALAFTIGADADGLSNIEGSIDEVRFHKGVAVDASDSGFTDPSAEWPKS